MRAIALVDGERSPPVTRWALEVARCRGVEVVAALVVGGIEKLLPGDLPDVGVPVRSVAEDRAEGLRAAIAEWRPEVVLDLSDEPVLGYRERMELASVSLVLGVPYQGADFRFDPPVTEPAPLGVPVLAGYGTGNRTGETAIAGEVARRRAPPQPCPMAPGPGRPPARPRPTSRRCCRRG